MCANLFSLGVCGVSGGTTAGATFGVIVGMGMLGTCGGICGGTDDVIFGGTEPSLGYWIVYPGLFGVGGYTILTTRELTTRRPEGFRGDVDRLLPSITSGCIHRDSDASCPSPIVLLSCCGDA